MPIDESIRQFRCIYIPADANQPLADLVVDVKEGETLQAMTDFVKTYIVKNEEKRKTGLTAKELAAERNIIASQIKAEAAKNEATKSIEITDDIVDRLMSMNNVDSVALQTNTKNNGFIAVNLYVDDQGIAKKLPYNQRASQICALFGVQLDVLGDAFIAKYMDDDDNFTRMDITLEDLRGDWVKEVRAYNLRKTNNDSSTTETIRSIQQNLPPPHKHNPAACGNGRVPNCTVKPTKKCGKCKGILYCNQEHQKADWKFHSKECKALEQQ